MAISLAPVATSHNDMTEASLNGYVVDFYITIREENLSMLQVSIFIARLKVQVFVLIELV